MSDNADWPKPREAGTHIIYPVTAQPPARPFFAVQYLQKTGKPVEEFEVYQTTHQSRRIII